jgi:hypothetical protein
MYKMVSFIFFMLIYQGGRIAIHFYWSNINFAFTLGKVWGLNFLSEQEALEFMSFCEVSKIFVT